MVDRKERIRRFIGKPIIRIKRFYPIGAIGLLILSNALIISSMIEWRGVHPYVSIVVSILLLTFIILFGAYLYLDWGHMYRAEKDAEMPYLPANVYLLTPYEQMLHTHTFLPLMKFIAEPTDKNKQNLLSSIKKFSVWVEKGVIPKKHLPETLKKYYLSNREEWY